ncbi:MAG TPA: GNA1162 family protein [Thermodesulfovibrionales bacterium]|jgi:hypothetical protein|nr:GNA1162 family protein [Thermodesulfovibrionales bacterium]
MGSRVKGAAICAVAMFIVMVSACASHRLDVWRDENMDFGAIKTVAVMPFANLSQVQQAGSRVRDTFMGRLIATGGVYVLPPGDVARGIARAGVAEPTAPSQEEAMKFCGIVKADAVITGVVKEYGEVRSGQAIGSIIALSMSMLEGQTGKIVWTASSQEGGISVKDRLLGPSGKPMNEVTEQAVDDIIDKLF